MSLKYILKDIFLTFYEDIKKSYVSLGNVKKGQEMLLVIMVVETLFLKFKMLFITLGVYLVLYIWYIIQRGRWRHFKREDYKKV